MNFKEWYKTMPSLGMSEEAVAGVAWKACKKEVLKILQKYPNLNKKTSLDKAFKEIEKL
jgi:hypothetical protein